MRKLALPLALLLCGCGGGDSGRSAFAPPAKSTPDLARAFSDTTRSDQAALLELLRSAVGAGQALGTAPAERCWQREQSRPPLAEACLIAWAIAPQKSELLEAEIARLAPRSRAAAVAAVRSEAPLARVDEAGLREILRVLREDPVWLRAKAILAWRGYHAPPGIPETDAWAKLLGMEASVVPADFRFGYLATQSLDGAKASIELGRQCNPLAADERRAGCWRFLSAFIDEKGAQPLPAELRPWLPARGRAWDLFRLSWPERARLLETGM